MGRNCIAQGGSSLCRARAHCMDLVTAPEAHAVVGFASRGGECDSELSSKSVTTVLLRAECKHSGQDCQALTQDNKAGDSECVGETTGICL